MRVQSINSNNFNSNFKRNQKNIFRVRNLKPSKAAETFGLWFGFGVGLDFLSRKVHFCKSPAKNSIAVNGILAALAASWVFIKGYTDKKADKNELLIENDEV